MIEDGYRFEIDSELEAKYETSGRELKFTVMKRDANSSYTGYCYYTNGHQLTVTLGGREWYVAYMDVSVGYWAQLLLSTRPDSWTESYYVPCNYKVSLNGVSYTVHEGDSAIQYTDDAKAFAQEMVNNLGKPVTVYVTEF